MFDIYDKIKSESSQAVKIIIKKSLLFYLLNKAYSCLFRKEKKTCSIAFKILNGSMKHSKQYSKSMYLVPSILVIRTQFRRTIRRKKEILNKYMNEKLAPQ